MQTIAVLAYAQDFTLAGFHVRIIDTLTFLGNLVGLGAAAGKTVYDLHFNLKRYKREQGDPPVPVKETEETETPFDAWIDQATNATEAKNKRADKATLIAFVALGVSFLLSAVALIRF